MYNNTLNLDNLLNININSNYVDFVVDIIPLFNDSFSFSKLILVSLRTI